MQIAHNLKMNTKSVSAHKRYLLDGSDSDSDSDSAFGIYGQKINQTKQGMKNLHSQKILIEGNKFSLSKNHFFN